MTGSMDLRSWWDQKKTVGIWGPGTRDLGRRVVITSAVLEIKGIDQSPYWWDERSCNGVDDRITVGGHQGSQRTVC